MKNKKPKDKDVDCKDLVLGNRCICLRAPRSWLGPAKCILINQEDMRIQECALRQPHKREVPPPPPGPPCRLVHTTRGVLDEKPWVKATTKDNEHD